MEPKGSVEAEIVPQDYSATSPQHSFLSTDGLLTVFYFDMGYEIGFVLRSNRQFHNPLLLVDIDQDGKVGNKTDLSYGVEPISGRLCVSYLSGGPSACTGPETRSKGTSVSAGLTFEISLRIPKSELTQNGEDAHIVFQEYNTRETTSMYYPAEPFQKVYALKFANKPNAKLPEGEWPKPLGLVKLGVNHTRGDTQSVRSFASPSVTLSGNRRIAANESLNQSERQKQVEFERQQQVDLEMRQKEEQRQKEIEQQQRELQALKAQQVEQQRQLEDERRRREELQRQEGARQKLLDEQRRQDEERKGQAASPYVGPSSGTIIWTGDIRREQLITIDKDHADIGKIQGSLPSVACIIQPTDSKRVSVASTPGPRNNYERLVLRVRGNGTTRVTIKWSLQ
jgi:hypothetical protein